MLDGSNLLWPHARWVLLVLTILEDNFLFDDNRFYNFISLKHGRAFLLCLNSFIMFLTISFLPWICSSVSVGFHANGLFVRAPVMFPSILAYCSCRNTPASYLLNPVFGVNLLRVSLLGTIYSFLAALDSCCWSLVWVPFSVSPTK